ncbi:mucin-associated surface protein (MASP), putative [Anaeromyxobacter sp. K]|uniref:hypothetical protein n=1 Tax=Anaeromyxobacter sp. (strain K) TaxID=447217 RepID=UPI00015FA07E|nr:hypothetical protein [Anaeromyxobacter sp. K]ACG72451.1 mucin-associated surface protein (MASP), putative [Anaeromyxobacter sp. K]
MIAAAERGRAEAREAAGRCDARAAGQRFDEALQRARRADARGRAGAAQAVRAERGRADAAHRGAGESDGDEPRAGGSARAPSPASRAAPDRAHGAGAGAFADAAPQAPTAAPTLPGAPAPAAPADVAALRAAVRALPAAIEAAQRADGSALTLAFGSALGVDLRAGAGGIELTLRPAAALARAAQAELPGLTAALRARGLRVARAEVRARPDARGPARGDAAGTPFAARVDGAPGLL